MSDINQPSTSGKVRGERIRLLREGIRLSRRKFCEKYAKHGIASGTLQGWEDGRWGGITDKGAKKLINAFIEEGLKVTEEWIMYGIGNNPLQENPFLNFPLTQKNLTPERLSQENIIAKELQYFHQLNSEMIDCIVTDDAMAPWLRAGDLVAGKRYFDKDIEKAIGFPSIVQTLEGIILVRMINAGCDLGFYTLTCNNPNTTVKEPILKDVKLFSAAPIIWIRKLGITN